MEAIPEQALIADGVKARENLSARYGVPARLLVPAIDPLLEVVDDHVIFPFSEAWSHKRWARVSSLEVLERVCFSARRVLEDKTLMLFIMPYISLRDASVIYGLIENRGDIEVPVPIQDMVAGFGGQRLPVPGRHGVLLVRDPDRSRDLPPLVVKFCVINYGLLESKAKEHEKFAAIIDETKGLLTKVNLLMTELLGGPVLSRVLEPQYIQKFEDAARIAQEDLILSLYMHGMDPHDVIDDTDTDVHDGIYDEYYDPCNNPNVSYEDMPEDNRTWLEDYMHQLEISGRHISHPKQAEFEVIAAQGICEEESVFARASKSLNQLCDTYNEGFDSVITEFTSADCRCSLIGVQGKRTGLVVNPPEGD